MTLEKLVNGADITHVSVKNLHVSDIVCIKLFSLVVDASDAREGK